MGASRCLKRIARLGANPRWSLPQASWTVCLAGVDDRNSQASCNIRTSFRAHCRRCAGRISTSRSLCAPSTLILKPSAVSPPQPQPHLLLSASRRDSLIIAPRPPPNFSPQAPPAITTASPHQKPSPNLHSVLPAAHHGPSSLARTIAGGQGGDQARRDGPRALSHSSPLAVRRSTRPARQIPTISSVARERLCRVRVAFCRYRICRAPLAQLPAPASATCPRVEALLAPR